MGPWAVEAVTVRRLAAREGGALRTQVLADLETNESADSESGAAVTDIIQGVSLRVE